MSSQNDIIKKQAYLREQIPQTMHQDFGEFCQSREGNLNIEEWSFDHIKHLVQEFKRQKIKQQNNDVQSYHKYQTGNIEQVLKLAMSLTESKNKIDQNSKIQKRRHDQQQTQTTIKNDKKTTNVYENNQHKQMKSQKQNNGQNAIQILQSFVPNKQSSFSHQLSLDELPPVKKQTYDMNNYRSIGKGDAKVQNKQKAPETFFQSNNFWDTPNSTNIVTKTKKTQNQFNNFQKQFESEFNVENKLKHKSPQPKTVNKIIKLNNFSKEKTAQVLNSQMEAQKKSTKNLYTVQQIIKNDFQDVIPCYKSFQRDFLQNATVTIIKHEIIQRRFLAPDYVMYHLKVQPRGMICKRNLEDFIKLRQNLQKVYPGTRLSYLQKAAGWLGTETSVQNIQKQQRILEYFLQDLLKNNELKNSRLVQDFLTLAEHKQIKRKFEEYEKIEAVASIEELCLLAGEVKVQFSQGKRIYCSEMEKEVALLNQLMETNISLSEQTILAHQQLALFYSQLAVNTYSIIKSIRAFNSKVTTHQLQKIDVPLKRLRDVFKENAKTHQLQQMTLNQHLLPFLQYEKQNMHQLVPIFEHQRQLSKAFLKRKEYQKQSNEQYLVKELKNYKTSVMLESKNLCVLKYQCGYLTNECCNQSKNYFDSLAEKIQDTVKILALQQVDRMNNSLETYKDIPYHLPLSQKQIPQNFKY